MISWFRAGIVSLLTSAATRNRIFKTGSQRQSGCFRPSHRPPPVPYAAALTRRARRLRVHPDSEGRVPRVPDQTTQRPPEGIKVGLAGARPSETAAGRLDTRAVRATLEPDGWLNGSPPFAGRERIRIKTEMTGTNDTTGTVRLGRKRPGQLLGKEKAGCRRSFILLTAHANGCPPLITARSQVHNHREPTKSTVDCDPFTKNFHRHQRIRPRACRTVNTNPTTSAKATKHSPNQS